MTDPALDWRTVAACADRTAEGSVPLVWVFSHHGEIDPDERVQRLAIETMTTICRLDCPVQADCLDYALTHNERDGVWGGLFDRQLTAARRLFLAGASAAEAYDQIAPKALI